MVWRHYRALSATRQSGMVANPITYLEIEAYARLELVDLTAWEVRLIRRIDNAVLAVAGGQARKSGKSKTGDDGAIPTSKPGAIKQLFRGLAAMKRGKS